MRLFFLFLLLFVVQSHREVSFPVSIKISRQIKQRQVVQVDLVAALDRFAAQQLMEFRGHTGEGDVLRFLSAEQRVADSGNAENKY